VDASLVRDLRERVLASRGVPDPLPTYRRQPAEYFEFLGISPERFDEVAQEEFESHVLEKWGRSALLVPELRALGDPLRLRLRFASRLLLGVESTTDDTLEYWIPGEPELRLTSSRGSLYMLPWTAEADGSTWQLYDMDVVETLIQLSPPGALRSLDLAANWEQTEMWRSVMSRVRREVDQLMESRSHARPLEAR
jgi:hypothetical protein